MKCTSCHTHLPEFGRFQKKVCPNCGKPITETVPISTTPTRKTESHNTGNHTNMQAEKARDALVLDMLISLGFLLIALFAFMFIREDGPGFPFYLLLLSSAGLAVTTLELPILLIRALYLQRKLPKFLRPGFSPVVGLLFLGLISAMLIFMLGFGIHQSVDYAQNEPHFVSVEATITRIFESGTGDDVDYDVYISYEFDGETYEDIEYPKYKSSMDEGDTLSVKIDPEDPDKLPENGTTMIIITSILTPISLGAIYLCIIKPLYVRRKARKQTDM